MSFRLLVIDDSLTIRKLVELSFKATDCSVEFAPSGQEGITKATTNPPDIILLDFVLPDMKGIDVCQRLAVDERTAETSIIVCSAKHENVRELFKDFPSVADFVGKPFGREDIVNRVATLVKKRSKKVKRPVVEAAPVQSPPPPKLAFSFEQKQASARALFSHLKPQLAQIPEWATQLGANAPATFFAKKILSPEVMEQLLDALIPFYRDLLGAAAPARFELDPSVALGGQVSGWPVLDLFRTIAASERMGELALTFGEQKTLVYWRRGEVLLATSYDPVEYAKDGAFDVSQIPAADWDRAAQEQKVSGKPAYAVLAESGLVPATELPALLHHQGKRALGQALAASTVHFEWRDRSALPIWAEAHGRVIPLAQMALERLRVPGVIAPVEKTVPSFNTVFERSERFSQKVRPLELAAVERRVLTLVDGKNTVQSVIDRSGIASKEAVLVFHRLAEVDLIRRRRAPTVRPRVLILEPDVEGFQRPLAKLLGGRSRPLELMALDKEKDWTAAIAREHPCLVIINATAAGGDAEKLARMVSGMSDHADLQLVAVLDHQAGARAEELSTAGYDAVLAKPVHFSDLERLLGARSVTEGLAAM